MGLIDKRKVRVASALSKKHKVGVKAADEVCCYGTYWDEGSRYQYYTLDLATGAKGRLEYSTAPEHFGGRPAPTYPVQRGTAIVRHGIVCGKEATPTLHVHYLDLPALFGIDFTFADDTPQEIVLDYVRERGFDV